MKIPTLFTGAHSYAASPIELWFAVLKTVDLNPRKQPMGKAHFENVVQAVIRRAREIPKPQVLLYWHHCLMEAYKYLDFHKL